jgi:hypothetical protein
MSLSQGRKPRPPHLVTSQHGIEDDQQLPHARSENDLRWLAFGQKASGEGTDHGVVLLGTEGSHVETSTDGGSSAPDRAATSELAAVPVERGHAHERGNLLPVESSNFRQLGNESGCSLGSDSGNALEPLVPAPPVVVRLDELDDGSGDPLEILADPLDRLPNAIVDERGVGLFAAVFLGNPVIHELLPPNDEFPQLLLLLAELLRRRVRGLPQISDDWETRCPAWEFRDLQKRCCFIR